jgi:predicted PurR-regulated permease PerM
MTSEQKQTWLWLAVGLALLWMLGPVLAPFVAGAIVAYALNPAVDWLSARRIAKRNLPRSLAVMIVILAVAFAMLALILIVLPVLQKQLPLLQQKVPLFLNRLDLALSPWLERAGLNMRFNVAGLHDLLSQQLEESGDKIWATVLASAKVGGIALLGWLGNLILIPVVLFYLLLDWHGLIARGRRLIPPRWLPRATGFVVEVNGLLAQYLRGQLAVMLTLAIYYSAALAIAGFDVALPVGILTGLLIFIPYLGYGLGLILAVLAALLQFDSFYGLGAVVAIYGFGQVLESFLLTPRLVGEKIGLHPLAVIFALLAFGQVFGFVGILLALPASAIVAVALRRLGTQYTDSSFYRKS